MDILNHQDPIFCLHGNIFMKKVLITGISGQDGSYLAELLLDRGYEVHGIIRRESLEDKEHKLTNLVGIINQIHLHTASIDNHLSIYKIISQVKPDECYHLAAASFVSYSFDDELSVLTNNFNSTHYLLSSIKELCPECKFYFAGSSEMFGDADVSPQCEDTKFNPRSIYGISKLSSYHLVKNYRKQHGIFACTGILFNHESPRRGYEFVTKKIVASAVKISMGLANTIELGNIEALRDWGYSKDYVEGMTMMLAHSQPEDFVLATGELHSVKDFLDIAFSHLGLDYRKYLVINQEFFRPNEAIPLKGDYSKAKTILGWHPKKAFKEIIHEMIENELKIQKGKN